MAVGRGGGFDPKKSIHGTMGYFEFKNRYQL
jgi:hypothetical protein